MSSSDPSIAGRIRVRWDGGSVVIALRNTPTARKLLKCLPFESRAQSWGEEAYFQVPVRAPLESDARQRVAAGDVCFWCEGGALALPYGRTPLSTDSTPVLVSPCNFLGRIDGDPRVLAQLRDDMRVHVDADLPQQ